MNSIEDRYLDQPYELADRVIDPIGGSATYRDQRHPLNRKLLEVLACLASASDAMVARKAFIDLVWNGNALVGETGLTNAIYTLRRLLQDTDPDKPLIRTIPRRGYQLTARAQPAGCNATVAFSPGAPVIGKPDWHLSRLLGSSPVSETWLVEQQGSRAQRVFRFCRSEQHLRLLRRETTVMRYLREALAGRNDTVTILDWQLDEPPYHLEMDYAAHGTLAQWAASQGGLSQVAFAERVRLIGQVATALAAVHAASVVHRNLGATSILIDNDNDGSQLRARLGGFGLSELTDRTRLQPLDITSAGLTLTGDDGAGAQAYLAPEQQAGQPGTPAGDVYALGVTLLQMVVADLQRIPGTGWEHDVESPALRELIATCTDAQADRRPTAETVSERLRALDSVTGVSGHEQTPSDTPIDTPPSIALNPPASLIGQAIGPYQILDQLGEGGMGAVYLAEQTEPVQRKVALKLIKTGMDSKQVLARFEAERQALALMNHANVATVYDAGSTPLRQPYFAMEYVRGLDITAHCDQLELDFRARITLFLQACEGVLHAHQKGLIHRDIKPGNILVSRVQDQPATVKIIDFGVAKSLSGVLTAHAAHTRLGSFVGTPAYSSPEQVSGPLVNVDTRTDIYSLGVVLYQLLVGVTPYSEEELNRKTPVELARLLSGDRPPSLLARFSSLSVEDEGQIAKHRSLSVERMKAMLGADVSWIVGKCLESDPDDRYPSVLELEKDLRRWLDDQPIEARPASRMYRARKFVRRHRAAVALASVMTLALLTTTTAAVIGFVRAEDALKAARKATAEAEMAADFQVKQMQSIDPAAMGLSLRSALIEAVQKQGPGGGDPATAAQRRQQQENLLKGVNFTDLALNQLDSSSFQPALVTIKKDFGNSPLLQARLWQTMADTLLKLGQFKAAVEPQRLALEQRRLLLGADHPLTLISLRSRGELRIDMSQYKDAESDLRAAMTGLRRVLGSDHRETLRSIASTGDSLSFQGKIDMGIPLSREVYARRRRTLGNDHRDTLKSARDLASLLMDSGKHKEALPYAEASVNGFRRILSSALVTRDNDMRKAKGTLSLVYWGLGRHTEAEAIMREVVEESRQLLGDNHPITLGSISNLAIVLQQLDRPAEAEVYLRKVLESQRIVLGDEHRELFLTRGNLASVLGQQGKLNEAELILRGAITDYRRLYGKDHFDVSTFSVNLAMVLRDQGKFEEASAVLTESLAIQRRVYGNENRYTPRMMYVLASVLRMKGELSAASALLEDAIKIQRRTLGDMDVETLLSIRDMGAMAQAEGNLTRAETLLREALAGQRQAFGDHDSETLKTIDQLSQTLRKRGALDEAAALELELTKAASHASNVKS